MWRKFSIVRLIKKGIMRLEIVSETIHGGMELKQLEETHSPRTGTGLKRETIR